MYFDLFKNPSDTPVTMDVTKNESSSEDPLLCCRACLSNDGRLFNIHAYKLADAYAHITGISVDQDQLPQYLCMYCSTQVLKSASFRDMCLHTQQSLSSEQVKQKIDIEVIHKINSSNQFLDLTLTEIQTIECIDIASAEATIGCIDLTSADTIVDILADTSMACIDTTDIDLPLNAIDPDDINITLEPNLDYADIDVAMRRSNPILKVTKSKKGYKNEKPVHNISNKKILKTNMKSIVKKTDAKISNRTLKQVLNANDDLHKPNAELDQVDSIIEKTDSETTDEKQNHNIKEHKIRKQNVKFVGVDGVIKKTDSKVEYENQMQVLNISKDKLQYIKSRMRTIGYRIKKEMKTAIGENNGISVPGDIKINIETKNNVEVNGVSNVGIIRMPIKMRQQNMRKTAALKKKIDMKKMMMKSMKIKNGYEKRRNPENNYLLFDFTKFETEYNVKIVTLSKEEQLEEIASRKTSKNKSYQCEACGKGFNMEQTYNKHRARHNPRKGAFSCEICFIQFRIDSHRKKHQDVHRLRFICNSCGFVSRRREQAQRHYAMHEGKRFQCKHCEKSFLKRTTCVNHMRLAHPTLNVTCDLCGETFIGAFGLRQHQRMAHKKERQEFKCTVCSAAFLSASALSRHTDTTGEHTDLRPCEQCGENCASEEELQKHVIEQHPKETCRCEECDISFPNALAMDTHILRKHLGMGCARPPGRRVRRRPPQPCEHRSRVCDQCGRVMQSPASLRYHLLRDHQDVKLFACNECPKRFFFKSSFQFHMRSHTGERPFQCPACSRAFSFKSNLRRHHLTAHEGIRGKFKCAICERSFTTKCAMAMHVSTVHGGRPWPRRDRTKRPNNTVTRMTSDKTDDTAKA